MREWIWTRMELFFCTLKSSSFWMDKWGAASSISPASLTTQPCPPRDRCHHSRRVFCHTLWPGEGVELWDIFCWLLFLDTCELWRKTLESFTDSPMVSELLTLTWSCVVGSHGELQPLSSCLFGLYTQLEHHFNGDCLQRSQGAKSLKAHKGGRSASGEQGKNEGKSLQNLRVFIFSAWFLCSQDSHVISKST